MEGWIGEVHSHANKLKAIDVDISDEDIIVVLTAGLPPSYTTVIISVDAVKSKKLTLDFIITHLLNEEGWQVISADTIPEVKKEESDNATMSAKPMRTDIQCFYCLEKGHFSKTCPVKAKENKERKDKGHRKITAQLAIVDSDEEDYAFWRTISFVYLFWLCVSFPCLHSFAWGGVNLLLFAIFTQGGVLRFWAQPSVACSHLQWW